MILLIIIIHLNEVSSLKKLPKLTLQHYKGLVTVPIAKEKCNEPSKNFVARK